jgi:hypothetical protein
MSQSFVSQPFQLLLHLLQRSINTLCEGAWHLSQDRHRAGSWGWKAHESRLTWEVSWVALCIYLNSVSLYLSNPILWCHQDVTNCYNKKGWQPFYSAQISNSDQYQNTIHIQQNNPWTASVQLPYLPAPCLEARWPETSKATLQLAVVARYSREVMWLGRCEL